MYCSVSGVIESPSSTFTTNRDDALSGFGGLKKKLKRLHCWGSACSSFTSFFSQNNMWDLKAFAISRRSSAIRVVISFVEMGCSPTIRLILSFVCNCAQNSAAEGISKVFIGGFGRARLSKNSNLFPCASQLTDNMNSAYAELLSHANGQPKPNFTQYQLAISEIAETTRPDVANAFRELRHIMEIKFNLETLDDLITNALK